MLIEVSRVGSLRRKGRRKEREMGCEDPRAINKNEALRITQLLQYASQCMIRGLMHVTGRRASVEPQRTGAKESEAREARDPYLAHDLMDGGRSLPHLTPSTIFESATRTTRTLSVGVQYIYTYMYCDVEELYNRIPVPVGSVPRLGVPIRVTIGAYRYQ